MKIKIKEPASVETAQTDQAQIEICAWLNLNLLKQVGGTVINLL